MPRTERCLCWHNVQSLNCGRLDLNQRPSENESDELPTALLRHVNVGLSRLELGCLKNIKEFKMKNYLIEKGLLWIQYFGEN